MADEKYDLGELIVTFVAGMIAVGVVYLTSKTSEKKEVYDITPAYVSSQICEVISKNGKESTYVCEQKEKNKINSLAVNHYNELNDNCVIDTIISRKVHCYDTEKDKINKIRRKVNMVCVHNSKGDKLKCIRNF